jgi:hypothetical protein
MQLVFIYVYIWCSIHVPVLRWTKDTLRILYSEIQLTGTPLHGVIGRRARPLDRVSYLSEQSTYYRSKFVGLSRDARMFFFGRNLPHLCCRDGAIAILDKSLAPLNRRMKLLPNTRWERRMNQSPVSSAVHSEHIFSMRHRLTRITWRDPFWLVI